MNYETNENNFRVIVVTRSVYKKCVLTVAVTALGVDLPFTLKTVTGVLTGTVYIKEL